MISVAIAAYNGALFIKEQLDSIINQTVPPDEIVISDDGSTDDTLTVIETFKKEHPDFNIVLLTDKSWHFHGKNFEHAMDNTSGDYIFLADQDDIWMPDKVEKVLAVFAEHPDAELVCHNCTLVDRNRNKVDGTFNYVFSLEGIATEQGNVRKVDCEKVYEGMLNLNGMCMCLSRKMMDKLTPYPNGRCSHDRWIGFVASLENNFYFLNENLAEYRLHGGNVCGNKALNPGLKQRFSRFAARMKDADNLSLYLKYMPYCFFRTKMTESGIRSDERYEFTLICNIADVLRECETSNGIKGAARLVRLYCGNVRFRKSGFFVVAFEFIYVLFFSRRRRIAVINKYE